MWTLDLYNRHFLLSSFYFLKNVWRDVSRWQIMKRYCGLVGCSQYQKSGLIVSWKTDMSCVRPGEGDLKIRGHSSDIAYSQVLVLYFQSSTSQFQDTAVASRIGNSWSAESEMCNVRGTVWTWRIFSVILKVITNPLLEASSMAYVTVCRCNIKNEILRWKHPCLWFWEMTGIGFFLILKPRKEQSIQTCVLPGNILKDPRKNKNQQWEYE